VPSLPANLTKKGLITENEGKNLASHGTIGATRLYALPKAVQSPVPGQLQYPGYATAEH